ncbi:hypothetical protein SLEP1_g48730 [Rubroshorea leprosula]|uniref:Late embryogenesis abundant protein LEA-2 subgroup domain-containing protein n=1 Tax=Rubroshorea leprosula TaxID=152421 RepID=A0AAV5LVG1_9ROSI|nr:hypothetical protein SLEP1_g48730 [Rubroshorea leprosula]
MVNKRACCKCCKGCCCLIIILGASALSIWLGLGADNPICSVDYVYLPALNRTLNSTTNSTLYFNLKLENPNNGKGINYNNVKGYEKTAKKPGHVDYNMTVASQGVFPDATGVFRIDLVTAVRFKVMFLRSKRRKIMVGAEVVVDGNGSMVLPKKKKDIPLSSMAPKQGCCSLVLLILVNFLALINLVNFL